MFGPYKTPGSDVMFADAINAGGNPQPQRFFECPAGKAPVGASLDIPSVNGTDRNGFPAWLTIKSLPTGDGRWTLILGRGEITGTTLFQGVMYWKLTLFCVATS